MRKVYFTEVVAKGYYHILKSFPELAKSKKKKLDEHDKYLKVVVVKERVVL